MHTSNKRVYPANSSLKLIKTCITITYLHLNIFGGKLLDICPYVKILLIILFQMYMQTKVISYQEINLLIVGWT